MDEFKRQTDIPWLLDPPLYADAFRNNIKAFLGRYARQIPLPGQRRAVAYVVDLHSAQGITRLHVYHDCLDEQQGLVCDQCRCMGKHESNATKTVLLRECKTKGQQPGQQAGQTTGTQHPAAVDSSYKMHCSGFQQSLDTLLDHFKRNIVSL
jgi:hypothetical protein